MLPLIRELFNFALNWPLIPSHFSPPSPFWTTAFSRGSVAKTKTTCWRMRGHAFVLTPSEVQILFQQNILSGDGKKSTLCRTLGLSYKQLDMLLESNNLSPAGPPVKMPEDVKTSLDALIRSGVLNRVSPPPSPPNFEKPEEQPRFRHLLRLPSYTTPVARRGLSRTSAELRKTTKQ